MRMMRLSEGPAMIQDAVMTATPALVTEWRRMLEVDGETDRVGVIVDGGDDWMVATMTRAAFATAGTARLVPFAALDLMESMPGDREHAWIVVITSTGCSSMRVRTDGSRAPAPVLS